MTSTTFPSHSVVYKYSYLPILDHTISCQQVTFPKANDDVDAPVLFLKQNDVQ